MKNVIILGSTGSIGRQAVEVIEQNRDRFRAVGLAARRDLEVMSTQIKALAPAAVCLVDEEAAEMLKQRLGGRGPQVYAGHDGLLEMITSVGADLVLAAIVGMAGLEPVMRALDAGMDVALANKESMVVAGELLTSLARARGARIIPVDSEHSAVFQCLQGSDPDEVERIILTASGGPFRDFSLEELAEVTVDDALRHPNWRMGAKITVDSATMMNKGLEIIEARWLFNVDYDRIDVVVHPQSIVHSLVQFRDGSVLAQLGYPDMKLPILYALGFPERIRTEWPRLDLTTVSKLEFEAPDVTRFPCLALARRAGKLGASAPAALNAANEVAVDYFLRRQVRFMDIPRLVEAVLDRHDLVPIRNLEDARRVDSWARRQVRAVVGGGL